MKIDVLTFTQTMHSLLKSSLSLQNALRICAEILTSKKEKYITENILKGINEGQRLDSVLGEYKKIFPPIYISLISIGEESGNLGDVFGKLSEYLKDKNKLHQKIIQSLAYPILVLFTAVAVILILLIFVIPRLEDIFMAFTESSQSINVQIQKMQTNITIICFIIIAIIIISILIALLHKSGGKISYIIDAVLLKIPFIGKTIKSMQIHDFAFAMKLLTSAGFPFTTSLEQAGKVLTNKRISLAVQRVYKSVEQGYPAGESFEKQGVFPSYFCTWIKTAEYNGKIQEAFGNISDYYSAENENILSGITTYAEPVFILITGGIIICIITQFVIPIFNLMGSL